MICLSTLKDIDGTLSKPTGRLIDKILSLYDGLIIDTYHTSTIHYKLNPHCWLTEDTSLGGVRRNALKLGLDHTEANQFHFIDFDRLLFWIDNYPDELKKVLDKYQDSDFTVLGRTQEAMDSHPKLQRETESIANYIFKINTGANWDVLAASRIISRQAAETILEHSVQYNPACIDVEWPIIINRQYGISYIEVNGLSYESKALGIVKSQNQEVNVRLENLWKLTRMFDI